MTQFITPEIPDEIKRLSADSYKNIFDFRLGNENLFGTETLCGDWNGDLLVVAKDFAPSVVIENRRVSGEDQPYHHDPAFPTNIRLVDLLNLNGREVTKEGQGNTKCGVLYMSACFLLRADGKVSGTLPKGWEPSARYVLQFVLDKMPNLRKIACLGSDSFEFVTYFLTGKKHSWRANLIARKPVMSSEYAIFPQSHTGSFGVLNRLSKQPFSKKLAEIEEDWRSMFAFGNGNL